MWSATASWSTIDDIYGHEGFETATDTILRFKILRRKGMITATKPYMKMSHGGIKC